MDSDKPVNDDTEREVQEALDEAFKEVRDEGVAQLAKYMKSNYTAFRKQGFSRKNAFTFTIILYQNLLTRG
jgi:cell division protein FtsI/penicillin-binding protein 2